MDREASYAVDFFSDLRSDVGETSNRATQRQLVDFILQFQIDNIFIYRFVAVTESRKSVDKDAETRYGRTCCRNSTIATSMLRI